MVPMMLADRAERLYQKIAAADPTCGSSGGCFVWTTATSVCMHRVIESMLRDAEALLSAESREGFDALLATTLAVNRIHHWYRDTEAPQSCEAIARRFDAAWHVALAAADIAPATRASALSTLADLNAEWSKADHLADFQIRMPAAAAAAAATTAAAAASAVAAPAVVSARGPGGAIGAVRAWLLRRVLQTAPSCNVALRAAAGPLLRPLEVLSELMSLTVSELFMTLVVPFAAANVEARFARVLMIVFALNLALCNVIKNTLLLPRPRAPKQQDCAATSFASETGFGFPSSHSACALAVPAFAAFYSSPAFGPALAPAVGLAITVCWAGAIGFARLFLGVHSVVDVLAGWALGIAFALGFHHVLHSGALDALFAAPLFGLLALPVSVVLAMAHPSPPEAAELQKDGSKKDPTLDESVCVIGCAAGAGLGAWREHMLPWLEPAPLASVARLSGVPGIAARFTIALLSTGVAKVLFKILAQRLVPAPGWVLPNTRAKVVRVMSYVPMAWVLLDAVPVLCGGSAVQQQGAIST
jgi:membrane-associated phospholipid phosphatase